MKTNKLLYGVLAVAAICFTACNDDDTEFVDGNGVALDMPTAVETGATYITLSTPFQVAPDAHWKQAGYCVSADHTPTVNDATYKCEVPEGMAFAGINNCGLLTGTISALTPLTEYHIRAYVTQYQGPVVYSPEFIITTAEGKIGRAHV